MKKYLTVQVSESQLEDLVRQSPELIEQGLKYVDHQKKVEAGRLDVLMVDSGNALVVAELKVEEDDGILLQGLDYYDYVVTNAESYARLYKKFDIDPSQKPRLLLIAPGFSVTLLNRVKWINAPITLFTYRCVEFEDKRGEMVPVYTEVSLPRPPEPPVSVTLDDHYAYITDPVFRKAAQSFVDELRSWDSQRVTSDANQNDISMKVSGRVFAYVSAYRKYFKVYTHDREGNWEGYKTDRLKVLDDVKKKVRANFERKRKGAT